MVSLGENNHRQGGYFQFDNSGDVSIRTQASSTEDLLNSSLSAEIDPGFRKINSTGIILVLLFFVICMEVVVCVVPELCSSGSCGIGAYSIVVYSHAGLWFIVMLADRYLRRLHYVSRTNGYLDFYRKTRNIRRMPLMIYSGGMAMLTILMVLLNDYCSPSQSSSTGLAQQKCPGIPLTSGNYLQLLISVETVLVLPILITYLVWTVQFNRSGAAPDVHQDDMLHPYMHATGHNTDVGFRDEDYLDDVLEKQADLIRYLKQHNSHLGKKLLKLSAQLNALNAATSVNSGSFA